MVDTDSEINLVKANVVTNEMAVNTEEIIKISGIINSHIFMRGSILINLFG